MASGGAIRAGKAFVELFTKDDRLRKGLESARKRLTAFGRFAAGIGAKMFAGGAAVVGTLTAAVFKFAKIGDQLDKMSARTGFSTEALSELGFAAEQSGSGIEDLEAGIKGMQRQILNAERGLSTAVDTLDDLGLKFEDLDGLSPDKQFELIAQRISEVEDPSKKAALAMSIFGKAGQKLIPLLSGGAAGIGKLRDEAKELGLSITGEQAKAAAEFTDAWNRIKTVFKATVVIVGGTLAPALTSLSGFVVGGASALRDWISEHKTLFQLLAIGGGALMATGALIFGIGGAAIFASMAIGGLTTVATVAGAVFGFLLSPVVLVTGAVLAAVAAVLYFSGAGGKALDWITGKFSGLGGVAGQVFEGLKAAFSAGDFKKVTEILWATINLAWVAGQGAVLGKLGNWKDGFLEIWFSTINKASKFFINTWAKLQKVWLKFKDFIGIKGASGQLEQIENSRQGALAEVDQMGQQRTDARQKARAKAKADTDRELAEASAELKAALSQNVTVLEKPEESKTVKAAEGFHAPGGAAKQSFFSGGNGDLKTQAGIETIAKLINMGGEGSTEEEQLNELRLIKAALLGQKQPKVARI